ncbi:MAG TPA: hypothetical protein VET65_04700 [Candidatus Limnocylindrales bacterium]|nr:hypothetical protein [Candidatus Limnocylindrales bacterium]
MSGVLLGAGFVSLFAGGALLLLAGVALAAGLALRYRSAARGWSALVYGLGATIAVLLLPNVLRPAPCRAGASGCYATVTLGTFSAALLIAVLGAAMAIVELRRGRRS